MSARSIKFMILIGVGAGALLLAGQAAATRTVDVHSQISIKSNSLHFSGEVTSGSYEPCQQFRKVKLLKAVRGGTDQVVGRDTTNAHGKWSITPQGSAGISMERFYAKVTKSSQGAAGTIYVCHAAISPTIKPTS